MEGIGAIAGKGTAGKKNEHAGKNGLFATLMTLLSGQGSQNHLIKKLSPLKVSAAIKSQANHKHHAGHMSDSVSHQVTADALAEHKKAQTHSHHQKEHTAAALIVPATLIQTTTRVAGADIQTLANQQEKSDGISRKKREHIETNKASHKGPQTTRLNVVQGSADPLSHAQHAKLEESELQEKLVTQKGSVLEGSVLEPATDHASVSQQSEAAGGTTNQLFQSTPNLRHALSGMSHSETISVHPSETAAGGTANTASSSGSDGSKSVVETIAEINAGTTKKETALKTNSMPNIGQHEVESIQAGATQSAESSKTIAVSPAPNGPPVIQASASKAKIKIIESKRDSLLASATHGARSDHAENISGRSNAMTQNFLAHQVDTRPHSRSSGDGLGENVDQQGIPQNNHAGTESRFAGLIQGNQSMARSDLTPLISHRSFQPLHVMEAMNEIALSAKNGHTRFDIQLEPAHLGKIHVSLQTDAAKQLMVHIAAEQTVSQQAIQQNMPQLRHALEQQGLSLGQFSMSAGSQDHSGTGQQFNGRHEWNATNGASFSAPTASVQTNTQTMSSTHGRLSIHV